MSKKTKEKHGKIEVFIRWIHMERIRNWYKINIAPVLPCLRMNRKSLLYAVCILGLFLFALNDIQIVWNVSRVLENNAAEGETCHLMWKNWKLSPEIVLMWE